MQENTILKIEHVSKFYPGVTALKDVSFTLQKGEVRALVGENGAASLHGFRQQGRKNGLLPARRPQGGRGSGAGQEKARQQGGKRIPTSASSF